MAKLEVKVFYARSCARCNPIHRMVARAKEKLRSLGVRVTFIFYDTDSGRGEYLADRYNITRIPTIMVLGDKYFVGIPDINDLVGTLAYLSRHPEGGRGVHRRG